MKINFDNSPQIVGKWTELGYQSNSVLLILLVPLVEIAWAEGFLQTSERRVILRMFDEIESQDEQVRQELLGWLDERPSDNFFASATDILSEWLTEMNPKQRESLKNFLQQGCLKVARSSAKIGLITDDQTICREEQQQLERIALRLDFSFA